MIKSLLFILSLILSLSLFSQARMPVNPTYPGWIFQVMRGKIGVIPGIYADSASLPHFGPTWHPSDSTRGLMAYTVSDSTFWGYSGNRWRKFGAGSGSSVLPGGSTYSIQYNGNGSFAGNSNFVYDTITGRLGIGTSSPQNSLHIEYSGTPNVDGILMKNTGTGSSRAGFRMMNNTNIGVNYSIYGSAHGETHLRNNAAFSADSSVYIIGNGSVASGGNTTINLSPGGFNQTIFTVSNTFLRYRNASGNDRLLVTNDSTIFYGTQPIVQQRFSNAAKQGRFRVISPSGSFGDLSLFGSTFSITSLRNATVLAGSASTVIMASGGVASGGTNHVSIRPGGFDTGGTIARFEQSGMHINSGNNTAHHASSILEVTSTTRGFLPPRMTATQRNAISSPATGLLVYDTTVNKVSVYDGTSWRYLAYE